MSRPWMPLYVAEYLADTAHFSATEHGAYLLLIMHYWQTGGLPDDDQLLARICKLSPSQWQKAKALVAPLFLEGWKHKRVEFELTEAARISAAGRTGGKASGQARRQRSGNDRSTIDERSLNDHSNDLATKREALQLQSKNSEASASSVFVSSSATSFLGLKELEEEQACGKNGAEFAEFWGKYPNKIGKKDARKKFVEALKNVSFEKLMDGLRLYKNKTDDRPWCNPATWLHQGRWDDQPAQQQPRGGVLGALDKIERDIENGLDREASEDAPLGLPSR